jgi:DNA-binding XRE family transcriptional regulator
MQLAEYMDLKGLRDRDFAPLISVTRETVSRIRRGRVRPSWETIQKIKNATRGAVTANDFESR